MQSWPGAWCQGIIACDLHLPLAPPPAASPEHEEPDSAVCQPCPRLVHAAEPDLAPRLQASRKQGLPATAQTPVWPSLLPDTPRPVQEDGVEQCMAAFHHHLPLEALAAGRPVNYKITEAHLTDVVTESISGAVGLFTIPVEGSRKGRPACCTPTCEWQALPCVWLARSAAAAGPLHSVRRLLHL